MSAPAVVEPVEVVEDNTFKVFAGNLAFSTTEDDLKTAFAGAGEVLSANIIVRNSRSLGYGFVSFATEAEAKKAVELMDKQELGGRTLNVEQAKPKAAGGERSASASGPRRPRNRRRPASSASQIANGANGEESEGAAEGGATKAPRRSNRQRRPKSAQEPARIDQDGEQSGNGGAEEGGDETTTRRRRTRNQRRSQRKPKSDAPEGAAPAEGGEAVVENAAAAPAPRSGRRSGAKKPIGEATGPLSKTTLFVANLPFKVDNDALANIFKQYKVASAKVGTLRNGRSKGFGFVEVENEEEQQKVLNDLKNVNVDGRELIIKVALATSQLGEGAGEEV
ncbi:hypothetical protein HDU76_009651, partial [Blyttiomyces sp. JEL0837]